MSTASRMMRKIFAASGLIILAGCSSEPPSARLPNTMPLPDDGDVIRGQVLYGDYCLKCHQLELGHNRKGPQLIGVYGSPAAALSDYRYSDALLQSGWVWDKSKLDAYLHQPKQALPRTKMYFDGLLKPSDREDVIAYLATVSAVEGDLAQ